MDSEMNDGQGPNIGIWIGIAVGAAVGIGIALSRRKKSPWDSARGITKKVADHSGDLAYDSGEYRESLVKLSDQTKAEVQGNYVMVFKRQPDGTWLIAEQMWTLVTPGSE